VRRNETNCFALTGGDVVERVSRTETRFKCQGGNLVKKSRSRFES